jgi:hypothetical protein
VYDLDNEIDEIIFDYIIASFPAMCIRVRVYCNNIFNIKFVCVLFAKKKKEKLENFIKGKKKSAFQVAMVKMYNSSLVHTKKKCVGVLGVNQNRAGTVVCLVNKIFNVSYNNKIFIA